MEYVFLAAACVSVLCVALICAFLLANGLPAMGEIGVLKFLSGTRWKPGADIYGIFPMIVGSVYVTAGALLLGVPVALLTAVYLAFFCPKGLYRVLKPAVELLAGIPSVVYGFSALWCSCPRCARVGERWDGSGNAMLTASILLAMMILPTIIGVVEPALRRADERLRGRAGAGRDARAQRVYRRRARREERHSGGDCAGRGARDGETMAVIMVAGNQPRMPKGILQGVRTLTGNIVIEMGYATGLHREALIATGVVLFVFILLINLCFSALKRGKGMRRYKKPFRFAGAGAADASGGGGDGAGAGLSGELSLRRAEPAAGDVRADVYVRKTSRCCPPSSTPAR